MRVITLVDNKPSPDDPALRAEWGLSQCIEVNGCRVPLDMGASDAFARNAERLGVDLAAVDAAILSHQHSDHGGGLGRFFELNDRAPVYLGDGPDGEPTGRLLGVVKKYIGLDHGLLAEHAARFQVVRATTATQTYKFEHAITGPDIVAYQKLVRPTRRPGVQTAGS